MQITVAGGKNKIQLYISFSKGLSADTANPKGFEISFKSFSYKQSAEGSKIILSATASDYSNKYKTDSGLQQAPLLHQSLGVPNFYPHNFH